jgi:hypothetical protein
MRDASALLDRDLCRSDLNSLINLNRIAVDDLAVEAQSYFNSERTLSRSCRPDDGDDPSAGILPAPFTP